MLSPVATPENFRTVRLRNEVVDLLRDLRVRLGREGIESIRNEVTLKRAASLQRILGPSDVVMLALELLKDHMRPDPKLGSPKKRK